MLAEPKFKLKWAEDPRNINWSKDTSKYGYKMLSKMGWSEGKGLGANENGMKSHVKISKRKENLGLGAATFHDDNWLSHQDDFSALLSKLNQKDSKGGEDQQQTSLQKNVQSSQRKILYSKFIKSKDLSVKSKNDLACIFGQRSQSTPATPQELSEDEDAKSDVSTASCPATTATPEAANEGFVKSQMNLQEYFASKMAALKQRSEGKRNNEVLEQKEEMVGGTPGEMKKKKKRRKDKEEKIECEDIKVKKDSSKKKKKKLKDLDNTDKSEVKVSECLEDGKIQVDVEVEEYVEPIKKKKEKKKKKKMKEDNIDEESNSNVSRKHKKSLEKLCKLQNLEKEGTEDIKTEDEKTTCTQEIPKRRDEFVDECENVNVKKVKKMKKKKKVSKEDLEMSDVKKEEERKEKTLKTSNERKRAKENKQSNTDEVCEPRKKRKKQSK